MKLLVIAFFAVVLFSCKNNKTESAKTDSLVVKTNTGDTLKNTIVDTASAQYCYITGIEKIHDSIFLKADYVDFYHDANVVEEAKRLHHADTTYDSKGKMEIFVPDDYFIVNDDKQLQRLYLPNNTPITMDGQIAGSTEKKINTFDYFSKHYLNSLFMVRMKDKIVNEVKEVFLP